jgi:hypothetical protein
MAHGDANRFTRANDGELTAGTFGASSGHVAPTLLRRIGAGEGADKASGMERLERTGRRPINITELDTDSPRTVSAHPLELPAGWKKLAGLEPGLPSTRETIFAELPALLGHASLDRDVAHRAVHAVVMGLAAGRWGKKGAPIQTVTTDRVLKAVTDLDLAISHLDRIDPAFAASFERFRLLATRALDHSGPNGLWGPTSIYGAIDNHPMNPSSLFPNFQEHGLGFGLPGADPDLLKRTGEHNYEFLPGNALPFVGPKSALNWFLGPDGNNGTSPFIRSAEGGAWRDSFGDEVVEKNGRPLYELFNERYAAKNSSKDAFFGVEGTVKDNQADTYKFASKDSQWITIGCSQVTAGHRFAATLYKIDGRKREPIDRSEGIFGPAGIHTKVPAGKYEVVIEQLDYDPRRPELLENSVGKRLGPSLMAMRKNFAKIYPETVDAKSERDPDRYRLFVSGSGKVDDSAFAPPERDAIRSALIASSIQESVLEQSIRAMEATLAWLDLFTPFSFLVPPKKPGTSDHTIERFMNCVDRLGASFYRSAELSDWTAGWIRLGMDTLNANLSALNLPRIEPRIQ